MTEQHFAFAVASLVKSGLRLGQAIRQVAAQYHVSLWTVEYAVEIVSF